MHVVNTHEMADANYTSNPANRCYFCKSELFEKLAEMAQREGWQTIVYGENASDDGRFSAGRRGGQGISGARAVEGSGDDESGDSGVVGGIGVADGEQAADGVSVVADSVWRTGDGRGAPDDRGGGERFARCGVL